MTFTYQPATDEGMVRLLCWDVDEEYARFSDEEIETFLQMEGSVKRAAARALEVTANSQTLILKVITTLDTQTNGPQVASDLRESAAQLREEDEVENGGFAIVDDTRSALSMRRR